MSSKLNTQGKLEIVNNLLIAGWVVDQNVEVPKIEIYVNQKLYESTLCNKSRNDVAKAFSESKNKLNAFVVNVNLKEGDVVEVYSEGVPLKGSPSIVSTKIITAKIKSVEAILKISDNVVKLNNITDVYFGRDPFPIEVYKVSNGSITNNGLVFVDGMLIKESTALFNPEKGGLIDLSSDTLSLSYKYTVESKDSVLSLCLYGIHNYYHFIFDFLQRAIIFNTLLSNGLLYNKIYIAHELELDFQKKMFKEVLNIECRFLNSDTLYKFDEIYLIHPVRQNHFYNREALDSLSYALKRSYLYLDDSNCEMMAKNYIYISRKNQLNRKLVNEDEIINYLDKKGFSIIYPEELSLEQQAKTFSQADFILGCSGAAFTNLIYCKEGCQVVEILPESFIGTADTFWGSLCQSLDRGIHHTQLFSKSIDGLENLHKDSFKVDFLELQAIVSDLLEAGK